MFSTLPPDNVTFPASGQAMVKSRQFAVADMVTVYAVAFERPSKKTLSALVGTLAPPEPHDVVLQFVVLVVFQLHVPPTQYRSAIFL